MSALGLSKGTPVWVPGGKAGWRRGTVAAVKGTACEVALDAAAGQAAGELVEADVSALEPANPAICDGVSDVTHLTYLNEPGILHVLRQRYDGDAVYTMAGPVLVAVNPFKQLPLYGPEVARLYSQRGDADGTSPRDPHVFCIADEAYKQMVALNQSQSVMITGESGAGKTETTKIVMRYLASLAGGTGMEDRVLETNPILEAFGNAKTIHNNNSSRFGKLIEIYFNRCHSICGALIHTYLLEKSRVVHQQAGERSYHIFYQLCRGASDAERERYMLPPAAELDAFAYLSGSGCTSIAGVDDAAEFAHVKRALAAVGIPEERQAAIFALLAAILWLGNVRFLPLHDDAVTVDEASMPAVRAAAALLQCDEQLLLCALCTRRMLAGGEAITRQLSLEAALDNRDALSKALYATLFKWLVDQINVALAVGKQQSETTLSILDIYGFEQFQENSFEQLCINYANERLQQQFSKHMFRLEQDVYESEGIDWTHVEFVDNQDCVDLIEARPPAGVGILSMLDEECMMPRGSDATFAAKLQQQHAAHPRFGYNARAPGADFQVNHYAGPVTYQALKFLDKNRDTLSKDLVALLQSSAAPLVQHLAAEMERGQDRRGSQTVGARFRDQLRDLIQRLDSTALHFVRCVKPNSQQVAGAFDAALVLHQLRCCGVLEVARIARAGYPTRYVHTDFALRYKYLLPEAGPGPLGPPTDALEVSRQLLAHFEVDASLYQVGRTRLFFRAGVLGQLEDAAARMQRSALCIQSTWRMARCRRAFLRTRGAAVTVQAHWRGRTARLLCAELLRQHRAAICIQAAARGRVERRRYRRAKQGVVAIQMAWRRHVVKERVAARLAQRGREEALRQAAETERRQREETFEAVQSEFGMDAAQIRHVLQQWQAQGGSWDRAPEPRPVSSQGGEVAADESGLLLEAAAASAVAQQRLEGVQAYCHKLERHAEDLREENELLHRAVSTLQQAVDESADPATAAHCRAVLATIVATPRERLRAPDLGGAHAAAAGQLALSSGGSGHASRSLEAQFAVHADGSRSSTGGQWVRLPTAGGKGAMEVEIEEEDDGDSISLMSLHDEESQSFTTDSFSMNGVGGTPTAVAEAVMAARAETGAVVELLGREFDKKHALLDDDAEFIQEVSTGAAMAPGMDAELELRRLQARYKQWKREFKDRLAGTQRVVKQLRQQGKRVLGDGPGRGGFSHNASAQLGSVGSQKDVLPSPGDDGRGSRTSRVLSHLRPRWT